MDAPLSREQADSSRPSEQPAVILAAGDSLGVVGILLGAPSAYRAVARGEVTARLVPLETLARLVEHNGMLRAMVRSVAMTRAGQLEDRVLAHNLVLDNVRAKLASWMLQSGTWLPARVVFKLLRMRVESAPGVDLRAIRGPLIAVGNHHYEMDGMLTGFAVTRWSMASYQRGPYFLVNEKWWLRNRWMAALSRNARLITVRNNGAGLGTSQYGYDLFRRIGRSREDSTVVMFPWGVTPAGKLTQRRKQTLRWILDNLEGTLVPVCVVGLDGPSLVGRVLRSLWRPLVWRIGEPVVVCELLAEHDGDLNAAEDAVIQRIIALSGGTLSRGDLTADEVPIEAAPDSIAAMGEFAGDSPLMALPSDNGLVGNDEAAVSQARLTAAGMARAQSGAFEPEEDGHDADRISAVG